jgi:hypothetical protein
MEIEARKRCPTCRQFLPSRYDFNGVRLNPSERRLLALVRRAGEGGIYIDELVDAFYRGADGGPLTAKRVVYVTICNMNKKLAPAGWVVRGKGSGYASPYKIKRLPASPAVTERDFVCASS